MCLTIVTASTSLGELPGDDCLEVFLAGEGDGGVVECANITVRPGGEEEGKAVSEPTEGARSRVTEVGLGMTATGLGGGDDEELVGVEPEGVDWMTFM